MGFDEHDDGMNGGEVVLFAVMRVDRNDFHTQVLIIDQGGHKKGMGLMGGLVDIDAEGDGRGTSGNTCVGAVYGFDGNWHRNQRLDVAGSKDFEIAHKLLQIRFEIHRE